MRVTAVSGVVTVVEGALTVAVGVLTVAVGVLTVAVGTLTVTVGVVVVGATVGAETVGAIATPPPELGFMTATCPAFTVPANVKKVM